MVSMMNDTIYIIQATKAFEKEDVRKILYDILGSDSIDRLLSIDGVECDKRVFVVAFWRVPSVNLFHDEFTEPTNYLLGREIPWKIELMDKYPIFTDGHYPAPHFLRNSTNLTDIELDELGIGGPGEFIYTNLPRDEGCDNHWEMYRCGVYYMPDMTYYNKPRLEPLAAIDRPTAITHGPPTFYKSFADVNPRRHEFYRWDGFIIDQPDTWPKDLAEDERTKLEIECKGLNDGVELAKVFKRWRDFYIEHPKSWPSDLTEEERALLQKQRGEHEYKSPWTPECGRDPTNMAEQQERLEALKRIPQRDESEPFYSNAPIRQTTDQPYFERWMASQDGTGALTVEPITRQQTTKTLERQVTGIPVREVTHWSTYKPQARSFLVDSKFVNIKDKKVYRSFD